MNSYNLTVFLNKLVLVAHLEVMWKCLLWLHFPEINQNITSLDILAGTPFNCLCIIEPPSEVDAPFDLIVTVLWILTFIQLISASQFELSTSITIWTKSPGMNPSFSKWISALEIPLLRQQQLVISPCEVFCWPLTILVYLRVIYLENLISAFLVIP